MLARVGKWIYWGFCGIAVLAVVMSFVPPPADATTEEIISDTPPLLAAILAAMIWLCGLVVRLGFTALDRLFRAKA